MRITLIGPRWQLVFLSLLVICVWANSQTTAWAQEPNKENEVCLTCHSNPDIVIDFPDGSTATGHVKSTSYASSVHGQEQMTCGGCHPDHEEFPHAPVTAANSREYTIKQNEICADCHPHQAEKAQDSVHAAAMADGNLDAAVCVDCHGAHDTTSLHEARVKIASTCRNCHASVYDEYVTSIHGKALQEENNTDVPTCVDCHGVHNVESPHTTQFRLHSPELCASCHADEELMAKYDISTDVFDTYVADFHGTTVTLFEQKSPDAETNKAVCYDCHGVHAILSMDDPNGIAQSKENLLVTCQKCHPDATSNFPDSWTSHYRPTFEHQPLVATVNLFYLIVIPATIGVMGLFVLTDAGHRMLTNGKRKSQKTDEASGPAPDSNLPEDAS